MLTSARLPSLLTFLIFCLLLLSGCPPEGGKTSSCSGVRNEVGGGCESRAGGPNNPSVDANGYHGLVQYAISNDGIKKVVAELFVNEKDGSGKYVPKDGPVKDLTPDQININKTDPDRAGTIAKTSTVAEAWKFDVVFNSQNASQEVVVGRVDELNVATSKYSTYAFLLRAIGTQNYRMIFLNGSPEWNNLRRDPPDSLNFVKDGKQMFMIYEPGQSCYLSCPESNDPYSHNYVFPKIVEGGSGSGQSSVPTDNMPTFRPGIYTE